VNVPQLHRHVERLSDRELFVAALLGLRSLAGRIDQTLEAAATPSSGRPRRPPPFVAEAGDASVMALLGAISVAKKLIAELDSWRPPPAERPRGAAKPAGGLLR
jgi:hypothetical protein